MHMQLRHGVSAYYDSAHQHAVLQWRLSSSLLRPVQPPPESSLPPVVSAYTHLRVGEVREWEAHVPGLWLTVTNLSEREAVVPELLAAVVTGLSRLTRPILAFNHVVSNAEVMQIGPYARDLA